VSLTILQKYIFSVTLQGLRRYYKYPGARGGSSQHRQDSHFQAWGKKNPVKTPNCSKLSAREPFQPFNGPVRIAVPSACYAAPQKVQHRATKTPALSRWQRLWTCSVPADTWTPFCIGEPFSPPFISFSNEAKQ